MRSSGHVRSPDERKRVAVRVLIRGPSAYVGPALRSQREERCPRVGQDEKLFHSPFRRALLGTPWPPLCPATPHRITAGYRVRRGLLQRRPQGPSGSFAWRQRPTIGAFLQMVGPGPRCQRFDAGHHLINKRVPWHRGGDMGAVRLCHGELGRYAADSRQAAAAREPERAGLRNANWHFGSDNEVTQAAQLKPPPMATRFTAAIASDCRSEGVVSPANRLVPGAFRPQPSIFER